MGIGQRKKDKGKAIALLATALLLAACSGQYKGMPREQVLTYQTQATYGTLYSLATSYADAINEAIKADTLHPGLYADCGVALSQMGHKEMASRMFNTEIKAFPQSRRIVLRIKQRMIPEMMTDTLTLPGDTIDRTILAKWAYDSITALNPLPRVPSVIDSTDLEWIGKQTPSDSVEYPIRLTANQKREMLAEQQAETERLRQAHQDSVAAAKQKKIDDRKQQKIEREKAKKEKEKAKKIAQKEKKRLEKQRKKERQKKVAERKAQQSKKGGKK